MYNTLSTKDDILYKIAAEMKIEYEKSLNSDVYHEPEPKIAYSDLTVWFYNKDCQSALSEIKRIWDTIVFNKLGTKSL